MSDLTIIEDDLSGDAIAALLALHLADMQQWSPPGTVHALPPERLRQPDVTFYTAWAGTGDKTTLAGCGALKRIAADHGEIKSMRTPAALRRRGAGKAILQHIIDVARERGYRRLSLETGSQDSFAAAHGLYLDAGFVDTGPFGDYRPDNNSRFLTLALHEHLS